MYISIGYHSFQFGLFIFRNFSSTDLERKASLQVSLVRMPVIKKKQRRGDDVSPLYGGSD